MKKLFFLLALVCGMASLNTISAQSSTDEFTYEITSETERMQLHEMKQEMAPLGVLFNYNPEFDQNRNLIGIKVQVTFEDGNMHQFNMIPLTEGQTLTIERKLEDGELVHFVGQK